MQQTAVQQTSIERTELHQMAGIFRKRGDEPSGQLVQEGGASVVRAPELRDDLVFDTWFVGDAEQEIEFVEDQEKVVQIGGGVPVSYTHLRAHETVLDIVCRL